MKYQHLVSLALAAALLTGCGGTQSSPSAAADQSLKSATKNAITLQWNKNISASGYCIEKWDGSKWVQIKRYTSNANVTYTATGLKANTAYKFRIRAYKTIGNVNEYSAYSAVVTARTKK